MQRLAISERPNWRDRAAELGFTFHSPGGESYWDESAYYAFDLRQIEDDIEAPTAELDAMARELVDRVVRDERALRLLAIPESAWDLVRDSWRRGMPSLYGRFDFSYDGTGPAKLLEYNADTPTSLYEAGVFQWFWLEDSLAAGHLPAGADQFNSIHEKLVGRFSELAGQGILHLSAVARSEEDNGTIAYIEECARQAGFETATIAIEDIGLGGDGQFYDLDNRPIERLFKLYPWEWIFAEPFAEGFTTSFTGVLEPAWKAVLSNKGILPLLWDMAPGHPNLLPAFFEDDSRCAELGSRFVRKPLFSREGANIEIHDGGRVADSDAGPYGAEGFIRQAMKPLARFGSNHAVLGSWVIAGKAAGLGMREDRSAITKDTSRFVPHAIIG